MKTNSNPHKARMAARRLRQRAPIDTGINVPRRPNERQWRNTHERECARWLRQMARNHANFIRRITTGSGNVFSDLGLPLTEMQAS